MLSFGMPVHNVLCSDIEFLDFFKTYVFSKVTGSKEGGWEKSLVTTLKKLECVLL